MNLRLSNLCGLKRLLTAVKSCHCVTSGCAICIVSVLCQKQDCSFSILRALSRFPTNRIVELSIDHVFFVFSLDICLPVARVLLLSFGSVRDLHETDSILRHNAAFPETYKIIYTAGRCWKCNSRKPIASCWLWRALAILWPLRPSF